MAKKVKAKIKPKVLSFAQMCALVAPSFVQKTQCASVTELPDRSPNENDYTHRAGGTLAFTDAAGDTHTATVTPASPGYLGTFSVSIDQANDTLTWDFAVADSAVDYLRAGQVLTQNYTITLRDYAGNTTQAVVTVRLVGTNDAPVIAADTSGSVTEDASTPNLTDGGPLNFSDVDTLDTHTVTASYNADASWSDGTLSPAIASQLAAGFSTNVNTATKTGTWAYSVPNTLVQFLDADETVTLSFTVTVTDNSGTSNASDTEVITITIHGTEDAPVAASDTNWVKENTLAPATGNVLQSAVHGGAPSGFFADQADTDADTNDTLSVVNSGTHVLPHGTLVLQPNGSYAYTVNEADPAVQALGEGGTLIETFTYVVTDGTSTTTATLSITIFGTNDAPVDGDESVTTPEDTTLNVPAVAGLLANATDSDGGPLTITGFTIDGIVSTWPVGVNVLVPGRGTITINADGSYTFEPAANFNGPVPPVTYTVSDGNGGTDTSTLTITVTPINDAPVSTGIPPQSSSDSQTPPPLNVSGNFSDPDNDPLTFTATGLPPGLVIDPNTGIISGTIDNDASVGGPYSVTVTATDPSGATTSQTFPYTVANPPPVDGNETVTTPEDTSINVPAATGLLDNASDPDGDPMTVTQFTIAGIPAIFFPNALPVAIPGFGLLSVLADGSYSFVPEPGFNGPVPTVTYTVSDGNGGTDTSTLVITVTPVNDAPVSTGIPPQSSSDSQTPPPLDVSGSFSDPDNDPLTFTATGLPPGLVIDPNTGIISGTIDNDASVGGPYSVTVTATDPSGATTSQTFPYTVANPPPVAVDDTGSGPEDTPIAGNVIGNDTDPDGDPLQVAGFVWNGTPYTAGTPANDPAVGTLTINPDGSYTFVPVADYDGPVPVATYTVTDGQGGTDTSTLTLTITPVNDAPQDGDETNTVLEDTALIVANGATGDLLNNGSDPDGTPLSISGYTITGIAGTQTVGSTVNIPTVGSIVINANGSYTFTPAANYTGPIPLITYTVTDGTLTDTSTLTLTMQAVNDAPVLDLCNAPAGTVVNAVSNGNFSQVAGNVFAGWTSTDAMTGQINTNFFQATPNQVSIFTNVGTIDFTQVGLTGLSSGPGAHGAGQLSMDIAWGNGNPNGAPASFDVYVAGVLCARIQTTNGMNSVNSVTYFNGATGNLTSVPQNVLTFNDPGVVLTNWIIDLPATVPDAGDLVFRHTAAGPGAADDFRFDNVQIMVDAPNCAGNDRTIDYYQNAPPKSLGNFVTITDVDDTMMESATIVLTNAQAGDVLAAGTLPGVITSLIDTSVPGLITVTLTGTASLAAYGTAIEAITFANTAGTPSLVDRILNVTVNDGSANSNVAVETIHVHDDTIVNNDNVISFPDPVDIPFYALLWNDVDRDQAISVTGISGVTGGTAALGATAVNFDDTGAAGGSFTYTGSVSSAPNADIGLVNFTQSGVLTATTSSILISGGGSATMTGSTGDDVLIGNGGDDNLTGGQGRDLLNGGTGDDNFIFTATNDSGATIATADVIMDFEPGDDDINLIGIDAIAGGGDNAFAFGGQNVNVVANSVTWFQAGGQTIVQIDNNGNTTADMVIVLTGLHTLAIGDFNL